MNRIIYEPNMPDITCELKSLKDFEEEWEKRDGSVVLACYEDGRKLKKSWFIINEYEELGVYLSHVEFTDPNNDRKRVLRISLGDRNRLSDVVDVDCDLYVSEGLFIPKDLAWKGIEHYILTGELYDGIEWIDPDEVPEDGNWF